MRSLIFMLVSPLYLKSGANPCHVCNPPCQAANSEAIKSMALLLGLLQLVIRWRRNDCTRLIKSGGESPSVSMLGTQAAAAQVALAAPRGWRGLRRDEPAN